MSNYLSYEAVTNGPIKKKFRVINVDQVIGIIYIARNEKHAFNGTGIGLTPDHLKQIATKMEQLDYELIPLETREKWAKLNLQWATIPPFHIGPRPIHRKREFL